MIKSLVGYTGFVGSNLLNSVKFDNLYNSKNIKEAFGTKPDLLVYAGVRAEKFLANANYKKDLESIEEAFNNIKNIKPKKIVLISTIDVYKDPRNVNEDSTIYTEGLCPYGKNRYKLEQLIENNFEDHLIVRLPALYGKNIKKNFIYDFMNIIPSLLTEKKYNELLSKDNAIMGYYVKQDNGFYKCKEVDEKEYLKNYFKRNNFTALNFTDSRNVYQFYNLSYLWEHITIALDNNIKKLNLATEPVAISELYKYIKKEYFTNELNGVPLSYDYKTKYDCIFGGNNGYIFDRRFVLDDVKKFVTNYKIDIK